MNAAGASSSPRDALVCVAHPDDETLWAMGYLDANPGTHVLCCGVPRADPVRIDHFFDVCAAMQAVGFVAGRGIERGRIDLRAALAFAAGYGTIITHNPNGEYGHAAHIAVHRAMLGLNRPTWVFGYGWEGCRHDRMHFTVDLDRKRALLARYTTRPNVFARQSKVFDLEHECLIRYS